MGDGGGAAAAVTCAGNHKQFSITTRSSLKQGMAYNSVVSHKEGKWHLNKFFLQVFPLYIINPRGKKIHSSKNICSNKHFHHRIPISMVSKDITF